MENFRLQGRTALVTGSSRGIGAAIALALAEAGADVVIHYTGNAASAENVAARAAKFGGQPMVLRGDFAEDGTAATLYQSITVARRQVDILVLNASIQIPKVWTSITPTDLERQMVVNYRSSLELMQLLVPSMVEHGWGRVLTIGSVQEVVPNPDMLVYGSLKNAQTALTHNLARQYARCGVTFNNLAPGVIDTDRYRDRVQSEEQAARVRDWIPAGYVGQPEDCAGAALLLCSEAGRYITGQNLFVDGGMSL